MSVSVLWSFTNGGTAITNTVDNGNASNGQNTDALEVFLRHDGDNSITSCGLYIRAFTGSYSGGATAANDLAELLAWGDASAEANFGGFQINQNAEGAYPSTDWPTYGSKGTNDIVTPANSTAKNVHRTGVGDSEGNAITILSETGATADGTIQSGSTPNVRFKCRVQVPSSEDTIGVRLWEHVLTFVFTS